MKTDNHRSFRYSIITLTKQMTTVNTFFMLVIYKNKTEVHTQV